ncbi:MAG: AzlD domain-containing protein, partial [Treponemataceae bacterium]|nr:AzlD domain-containing protein [Treponemataceae bacterium]
MRLPLSSAFVATVLTAAVIFLLRAFPFLLFSKKDPPPFLRFIEKYIPSMIMAILIVYCLK